MLTDPHGNSAADLVAKARAAKLGIPYLGRPTLDLDMSRAKSDPLDHAIAEEKEENEPSSPPLPSPQNQEQHPPESKTYANSEDRLTPSEPIKNHQNEPTEPPAKRELSPDDEDLTGQPEATPRASSVVSDKKKAANQANGLRSTGPKTPEGKARASQNALKHGLFSQASPLTPQFALLGEAELYAQTLTNLTQSLAPHDALELQLVDRLAQLTVQLDRLTRFESSLLARAYDQTLDWTHKFPPISPTPPLPTTLPPSSPTPSRVFSKEQALLSHHQSRLSREFAHVLTQLRLTQKLRIQTQPTQSPTRIRSLASDGQIANSNEIPAEQTQPPIGTIPTQSRVREGAGIHDAAIVLPIPTKQTQPPDPAIPTKYPAPEASQIISEQTQPPAMPLESMSAQDRPQVKPRASSVVRAEENEQTNPTPQQPAPSDRPNTRATRREHPPPPKL